LKTKDSGPYYRKIINDAEDESEEEKLVHRNHQNFSVQGIIHSA
jgi:hypothetical protein